MKHLLIPFTMGAMLCCAQAPAQKSESKEHIRKEFAVAGNASGTVVTVYNINGSVRVEGYDGKSVVFEVDKTISGTPEEIAKGRDEFKLAFEEKQDSIIAYIRNPFDSRPNRNNRNWPKVDYGYDLAFKIKVPYSVSLRISTINNGEVEIENVAGALHASNINGGISVKNAKGPAIMHTINGKIEANYLVVPDGRSDFKTLNGNINLTYPANLSADCEYKTFNGDFYTDFPDVEALPAKVVKNEENKSNKTIFKLDTETSIRIGAGGRPYRFETFNGNIYIKKQS